MKPAFTADTVAPDDGLTKSAALIRALGHRASAIWSGLTAQEAARLESAVQALPPSQDVEEDALQAYLNERGSTRADTKQKSAANGEIWDRLSACQAPTLATAIGGESPQILAVILSELQPDSAANLIRALPRASATEALRRLLHLGDIHPSAKRAIEMSLEARIAPTQTKTAPAGPERVARIFDTLDSQSEDTFLSALDQAEPGIGERIRALMFTFDDLANLGPASLQTLLASTDRAILIMALKGAKPETSAAFFVNMTSRAGDLLRSEIDAVGPVRRTEIDAARHEILALARTMVKSGEILSAEMPDEDLIE